MAPSNSRYSLHVYMVLRNLGLRVESSGGTRARGGQYGGTGRTPLTWQMRRGVGFCITATAIYGVGVWTKSTADNAHDWPTDNTCLYVYQPCCFRSCSVCMMGLVGNRNLFQISSFLVNASHYILLVSIIVISLSFIS